MKISRRRAETFYARESLVIRPPFTLLLILVVVSLSGCGLLFPYDRAVVVDDRPAAPPGLELAGDAEHDLQYVEGLREQYYNDLRVSFIVRGASGATAVGLSAWALYNALKPEDSPIPLGDKRRTARLGAGIAGLFGLRSLFVNPQQENAYAEGYQALTCLMVQSSPLLMTQRKSSERAAEGDVERLQLDLVNLDQHIHQFQLLVDLYDDKVESTVGPGAATNSTEIKPAGSYFQERSKDAKKALAYARNAWKDGNVLLDTAKHAGEHVREGAALIVSGNNVVIQGLQKDVPEATKFLGSQHDIMSAVLAIGGDTEADHAEMTSSLAAKASAAAATSDMGAARILPAAWRPTLMAQPPLMAMAGEAPSNQGTTAQPAAATCKDPTDPACKSSNPDSKLTTAQKPKTKAGAPSSAPAPTTSADLKALRDKLDATIKSLDDAEATRKKNAELKDSTDKLKALNDELTGKARRALSCRSIGSDEICTGNLLKQMEELYAARRPVAQKVLNFRERARQVEAIPDCADRATLRVVPSGPLEAYPGTTLEFIVSQRIADEAPFAALQGPTDADAGAHLTIEAVQGSKLKKVVVQIGKLMPPQRFRIVISDSRQTSTQVLTVNVKKALPPLVPALDPKKSAPSGPSSSGTT